MWRYEATGVDEAFIVTVVMIALEKLDCACEITIEGFMGLKWNLQILGSQAHSFPRLWISICVHCINLYLS